MTALPSVMPAAPAPVGWGRGFALGVAFGFTLVELMVVIAISAILLTIAIPAFNNTIAGARTFDTLGTLQASLDLARSDAIRRGTNVTVCRTLDPVANPPVCGMAAAGGFGVNDWAAGWVVFVDNLPAAGGGTVGVVDIGEEVIQRQAALSLPAGSRVVLIGGAGAVTYGANGLRPAGALVGFDADYRNAPYTAAGLRPRCLRVAVVGQLAASPGAC